MKRTFRNGPAARVADGERGDIVVGWLVKIIVGIALVGLVAYEAGAVIVAHVGTDTAANDASAEAAAEIARGTTDEDARAAAEAAAAKDGAHVVAFSVATDGRSVTLTVEKRARTVILQHFGVTRSWTVVRTTRRRGVLA